MSQSAATLGSNVQLTVHADTNVMLSHCSDFTSEKATTLGRDEQLALYLVSTALSRFYVQNGHYIKSRAAIGAAFVPYFSAISVSLMFNLLLRYQDYSRYIADSLSFKSLLRLNT